MKEKKECKNCLKYKDCRKKYAILLVVAVIIGLFASIIILGSIYGLNGVCASVGFFIMPLLAVTLYAIDIEKCEDYEFKL